MKTLKQLEMVKINQVDVIGILFIALMVFAFFLLLKDIFFTSTCIA